MPPTGGAGVEVRSAGQATKPRHAQRGTRYTFSPRRCCPCRFGSSPCRSRTSPRPKRNSTRSWQPQGAGCRSAVGRSGSEFVLGRLRALPRRGWNRFFAEAPERSQPCGLQGDFCARRVRGIPTVARTAQGDRRAGGDPVSTRCLRTSNSPGLCNSAAGRGPTWAAWMASGKHAWKNTPKSCWSF